jgi:hypothetical protein
VAQELPPVYLEFKADIKNITDALTKVEHQLDGFEKKSKKSGDSVDQLKARTVAAGALMAAGIQHAATEIFKFGKETLTAFADTGKEVRSLQRSIGGTAEDASRLRFAGDELGVTNQALTMGFKALAGHLDANDDKIKRMGIAYRDAHGDILPTKDVLANLAERFASMPNGLQKTALATDLFGKSGQKMIPILNQGKQGLKELYAESDKLGVTMSGKDLEAVKKYTLSQKKLKEAIKGAQITIGRELIPMLTKLVDYITVNVVPWFKAFANGLTGKDGVNDGLNSATTFAHNLGAMIKGTITFIIRYKDQLALLAAVLLSIYSGIKIGAAVGAFISGLGAIAAAWEAVTAAAGAAAVAEDVASGGTLTPIQIAAGAAGAIAVAAAIGVAYTKLKSSLPKVDASKEITLPAVPGVDAFKPPAQGGGGSGSGGGGATTPDPTLLETLKEEGRKMRARIRLLKLGASKGLVDAVMSSSDWSTEFQKLVTGGRSAVAEMQKIYNKTSAGLTEIANAHHKVASAAEKSAKATAKATAAQQALNNTMISSQSWLAAHTAGTLQSNTGSVVIPVSIDGREVFRAVQTQSTRNSRRNITNGLTFTGAVL